jgi:hypothetical protein
LTVSAHYRRWCGYDAATCKNAELRRIILDVWPDASASLATGEPLVEVGRR